MSSRNHRGRSFSHQPDMTDVECYYCNEIGHIKRNCPKLEGRDRRRYSISGRQNFNKSRYRKNNLRPYGSINEDEDRHVTIKSDVDKVSEQKSVSSQTITHNSSNESLYGSASDGWNNFILPDGLRSKSLEIHVDPTNVLASPLIRPTDGLKESALEEKENAREGRYESADERHKESHLSLVEGDHETTVDTIIDSKYDANKYEHIVNSVTHTTIRSPCHGYASSSPADPKCPREVDQQIPESFTGQSSSNESVGEDIPLCSDPMLVSTFNNMIDKPSKECENLDDLKREDLLAKVEDLAEDLDKALHITKDEMESVPTNDVDEWLDWPIYRTTKNVIGKIACKPRDSKRMPPPSDVMAWARYYRQRSLVYFIKEDKDGNFIPMVIKLEHLPTFAEKMSHDESHRIESGRSKSPRYAPKSPHFDKGTKSRRSTFAQSSYPTFNASTHQQGFGASYGAWPNPMWYQGPSPFANFPASTCNQFGQSMNAREAYGAPQQVHPFGYSNGFIPAMVPVPIQFPVPTFAMSHGFAFNGSVDHLMQFASHAPVPEQSNLDLSQSGIARHRLNRSQVRHQELPQHLG